MDPLSSHTPNINTTIEQDTLPSSSSSSNMPPSEMGASSGLHEHGVQVAGQYQTQEEYLRGYDTTRFQSITEFASQHCGAGLSTSSAPPVITRDRLQGDRCDMQGIEWISCRTTRAQVRVKRTAVETGNLKDVKDVNGMEDNLKKTILETRQAVTPTPNIDNSFSFKQMYTKHRVTVSHFQLRNLLATPGRDHIFYAASDKVLRTDTQGNLAKTALDLSKVRGGFGKVRVTTLAASDEVLVAGGFVGEYALRSLTGTLGQVAGRLKEPTRGSTSYITNHVHLCTSRATYTPQAILCSNDNTMSTLDCATNKIVQSLEYARAINCAATSPNGRMRVLVGDSNETYITNAETGKPFETLGGHQLGAFACDWADDGIHVATAGQDSTIQIYDARYWGKPLKVMRSELSLPRSIKFSPIGGGPRVLISAEADDYLNIINAQTFKSKQVFDFFGCTAGVSMTPDGSSLFMANADDGYGGIVELERCGWGQIRRTHERKNSCDSTSSNDSGRVDWDSDSALDADERVVGGRQERRRRGLDLGSLSI